MNEVGTLLDAPKVVAVGEIGLDYHFEDNAPLARSSGNGLPSSSHSPTAEGFPSLSTTRDAHGDTMELLCKYRPKGVVHCFSGSVEMMREVVRLGMYIGLGGAVTFKNARVPVEVAAAVPLDHLLLETDAPYMAPVPYRGKRCDSSMIAKTAERIAEIPPDARGRAAQSNAAECVTPVWNSFGGGLPYERFL